MSYNQRYIARVIIEAKTPIAIGSGNKDITTDSVVLKDVDGLPYIPGTSIAGLIRHSLGKDMAASFFGSQDKGSEIIFSEAKMIGVEGIPIDFMQNIDWKNPFYSHFIELPIRQHVRINEKGTSEDHGKFDEQVVYKGTRFCFEIEMLDSCLPDSNIGSKIKGPNYPKFISAINCLSKNSFRIGGGTRSGFGEISIIKCLIRCLNLSLLTDLNAYLNKSSNLEESDFWKDASQSNPQKDEDSSWEKIELNLSPVDFFLFSSGFGDEDADMTPVRESYITWSNKNEPELETPSFSENCILIPASSVKGALAHRTAYYWNKLEERFVDNDDDDRKPLCGESNPAVKALFGSMSNNISSCGNVIISDIIDDSNDLKQASWREKVSTHIAIDRFTAAPIDGALFDEKIIYGKGHTFKIDILVNKKAYEYKDSNNQHIDNIEKSLKLAINDLCHSMLPLGGGTNRGNGFFEDVNYIYQTE
jgi:CRISPR/Cas system CSM-associated protein Csm3 (group 7 of RAMP superfamily)